MRYWDNIIEEVIHGQNRKSKISLTNIQSYKADPHPPEKKKTTVASVKKKHYLGNNFPGVYFTEKELITTIYIFYGKTNTETAKVLALSKRTIEYYIKNIKKKLGCRYVTELVRKVLTSDLSEHIKNARKNLQ